MNKELANILVTVAENKFNTHKKVLAWCLTNSTNNKVLLDRNKMCEDLNLSKSNLSQSIKYLKKIKLLDEWMILTVEDTLDKIKEIL